MNNKKLNSMIKSTSAEDVIWTVTLHFLNVTIFNNGFYDVTQSPAAWLGI